MLYDGVYGPVEPFTFRELACMKVYKERMEARIYANLLQTYASLDNFKEAKKAIETYVNHEKPYLAGLEKRSKTSEAEQVQKAFKMFENKVVGFKVDREYAESKDNPFQLQRKPLSKDPLKGNLNKKPDLSPEYRQNLPKRGR
jgi:hypothetical protein